MPAADLPVGVARLLDERRRRRRPVKLRPKVVECFRDTGSTVSDPLACGRFGVLSHRLTIERASGPAVSTQSLWSLAGVAYQLGC